MGHFHDEHERRRAAMRQNFPLTAALVDRLRACGCDHVRVVHALEGDQQVGTPLVEDPRDGELERLFKAARANITPGTKGDGFVSVPGKHKRKARRL